MPKYRKKPVVIESSQWFVNGDHPEVTKYCAVEPNATCEICGSPYRDHGFIKTLEGGHIVCPCDWIITGVQGEHYPCKPEIFAKTYDKVDESPGRDFTAEECKTIVERLVSGSEFGKDLRLEDGHPVAFEMYVSGKAIWTRLLTNFHRVLGVISMQEIALSHHDRLTERIKQDLKQLNDVYIEVKNTTREVTDRRSEDNA